MNFLKYAAVICFIIAMFLECISYIRLCLLDISTKNMQVIRHPLIKQIFLRFTNCAKLNIRICNTPAFVTKYMHNYSVMGFHYGGLATLSIYFVMLGIGLTTIGTYLYSDIYYKYALISILCAVFYVFLCAAANCDRKTEQIINNITDYLDNTLEHRITGTAAARTPAETPKEEDTAEKPPENIQDIPETEAVSALAASKEKQAEKSVSQKDLESDNEIIFSVINDFLV